MSLCGLHIAGLGSMTYLARDEALWVQWRTGRIDMYVTVDGIERLLPEVPAPTIEVARRLFQLVRPPTYSPCQE